MNNLSFILYSRTCAQIILNVSCFFVGVWWRVLREGMQVLQTIGDVGMPQTDHVVNFSLLPLRVPAVPSFELPVILPPLPLISLSEC